MKPAEVFFYGGSEKKSLKKSAERFGGNGKKSLSLHPLSPHKWGVGKREAKEFLEILKGLKTNSKCESENKFDGYND